MLEKSRIISRLCIYNDKQYPGTVTVSISVYVMLRSVTDFLWYTFCKCPLTHILPYIDFDLMFMLQSIPPRGKAHNKLRVKIGEINTQLSEKLSGMENTQLLTIDPGLFINPYDGTISHRDMYDYLHFTRAGYQKFCEPILEEIQTLLKDFVKSGSHDASDDVASQGDSV